MTATQTQIRRDTATNLNAATPASGELGYDTTNKRLVVGDGTTAGGTRIPSAKDVQNQTFVAGTVGGTGDAITLTNSPVVAAYATNQRFTFKAGAANTTAVTMNVDSLGNKDVKKMRNGALAALIANDIISGGVYDVFYDGTQFQIKSTSEGPYTSGALVYLGTQTASSSSALNFESLMSSTYDDYVFILNNIIPATNADLLWMRTSTDNGSTYNSASDDYRYVYTKLTPTTTTAVAGGDGTATKIVLTDDISNNTGLALSGKVELFGVNNTAVYKNLVWQVTYYDSTGPAFGDFRYITGGGNRKSANSINAVRFLMSSGNIASGNIKLYAIAKA